MIPTKIQNEINNNPTLEWIDKYDRIYNNDQLEDTLKLENQYIYWRTNCSIRVALKEIEHIIKSSHKSSTRLVGWSEIARRAKCDRNTLKHSDRLKWIEERREKLLMLIEEKQNTDKTTPNLVVASTDEGKILNLRNELELSKKETAKWFVKYEEQSKELSLMKDALDRQLKSNSLLNDEIHTLKKRIKELMSEI